MRDLFVAEWLRVRRLVAIYAGLHLVVLFLMGRMADLLQQDLGTYQVFGAVHVEPLRTRHRPTGTPP